MSVTPDFKSIRCPLYGFVDINKRENSVLDTKAMQRLSRIKQLAHTYIVYPSAIHTRLEHSLGALCLAGRICNQLKLPQKQKQVIRAAALLHDVGQGPFSHIWEEPMRWINGENYRHEDVTRLIIESELDTRKALGSIAQDVLDIFDQESLGADIISSSLDVDKLDYLRRDSYHTGVAYGLFDIERVIRTICKISETDRDYLAIHEKGKDALENYRLARYAMHVQVYEHHTRLIADDMFLRAIKSALKEECIAKEDLVLSDDPNGFIKKFLKLDDFSIQHQILQNSKSTAKNLIEDIRNRRLLKRALEIDLTKEGVPNAINRKRIIEMGREEIEKAEKKTASELGIDPAYVVVHLQSVKIKLYERFEQATTSRETPIYVKKRNGSIVLFDEESPISAALLYPVRRLYVFCPREFIAKARKITEDIFKVGSPK